MKRLLKTIIDGLSPLVPLTLRNRYRRHYETWFIHPPILVPPPEPGIPSIFHVCTGTHAAAPFHLYQYLAIKSAIHLNMPKTVYFYCTHEPSGSWWARIRPYLTLIHIKPDDEVRHNITDAIYWKIFLIRRLNELGGVALDLDTLCIRPFTSLFGHEFVIGGDSDGDLIDAAMLAKPHSIFGRRLYSELSQLYSTGRQSSEALSSAISHLAQAHPDYITVIDAFWFPRDQETGAVSGKTFNASSAYALNRCDLHLNHASDLDALLPPDKQTGVTNRTLYASLARPHLYERSVSILFLTHNRKPQTIRCIESFLRIIDREDICELLILDNASNDGVREYVLDLEKRHAKVRVILSDANLGVCLGRIRLFREARGDIIASFDSDVILISRLFLDKCKAILRDPDVGMCGTSGAFLTSWTFNTQSDIRDEDAYEGDVDFLSGCCQIFDRNLLDKGVGLDPAFAPFWVEDVDFSFQIRHSGQRLHRIRPDGFLMHQWGESGKNFIDDHENNWNKLVKKWKGKKLARFERRRHGMNRMNSRRAES